MSIVEPLEPARPESRASHDRVVNATQASNDAYRHQIILNEVFLEEPATSAGAPAVVTASQEEQSPQPAPMTWIGLIDRVISGWAHTARTGILLIIVLIALITIIVVSFGLASTPFIVGAGGAVTVAHRRLVRSRQV